MLNQDSLPVSVKGVLFRTVAGTTEVLLLRNDRNEWELPGGRPEPGESPQESLTRELLEETGLAVTVGPRVHQGVLTILPPRTPKAANILISAYGCRLKNSADSNAPIAISSEHNAAAWIRVDDLVAMHDLPEIYKAAVLSWKRELNL